MPGCSKTFSLAVVVLLLVGIAGIVGVLVSRSATRTSGESVLTLQQAIIRVQADSTRVHLPTPTPEPPLPTSDWIAPSFAELCDKNDMMTPRQRMAYAQAMTGKHIVGWVGRVYAVERWDVQHYVIKVDMRGDYIFRTRQVEIVGVSRELAARLKVDQQLFFDGTIRSIQVSGEQRCNPIYLVEARVIPQ
jgi:hypothetical protein